MGEAENLVSCSTTHASKQKVDGLTQFELVWHVKSKEVDVKIDDFDQHIEQLDIEIRQTLRDI